MSLYIVESRNKDKSSNWQTAGIWDDIHYMARMLKAGGKINRIVPNELIRYRVYDKRFDNEVTEYMELIDPSRSRNRLRIEEILGPYIYLTQRDLRVLSTDN